mgnify:CR=1 FL=1
MNMQSLLKQAQKMQKELAKAAQNLADYYGLSQVKYQYIDDPRLHKIVIFWQYS